uniref:Uncharacterized protein n=1 Tax=Panagrolaimus sp. ES5 TaxID=591445 RepID=A0AC34FP10_9BILA
MNDYGRPIVLGETAARLAIPAAYVLSILLLVGLLHFNINDVGLTRAFEMFFNSTNLYIEIVVLKKYVSI